MASDTNMLLGVAEIAKPGSSGRLGNRKVHTGCKTCKTRKVKCDESKPVCSRCILAKRECLGYESLAGYEESFQKSVCDDTDVCIPKSLICQPIADTEGLFQFYMETAPSGVSGILDGKFWTRIVPQLGHSWSSIRYSLLCLSALLRRRKVETSRFKRRTAATEQSQHQFATLSSRYYSKAVTAISQEVLGVNNRDVAILTCIIFFCVEALQGNTSNAASLFRRGLSIMDEARNAFRTKLILTAELMFSRIRLAIALLHGSVAYMPLMASPFTDNESLSKFANICATRSALHNLTAEIYAFYSYLLQNNVYNDDGILSPDALDLQIQLLTRLESWRQRSTNYLSHTSCTTTYEYLAQLILRCHYLLNSIWLKCGLVMSELRFDAYTEDFSEIVKLCSEIIQLRSTNQHYTSASLFQLETGVLLPLFVTACKCRSMPIRQSALTWLKQCPNQEGLWVRDQMLCIASRVVEVESLWSGDMLWTKEHWRVRHTSFEPPTSGSSGLFHVTFYCQNGRARNVWDEWLTY